MQSAGEDKETVKTEGHTGRRGGTHVLAQQVPPLVEHLVDLLGVRDLLVELVELALDHAHVPAGSLQNQNVEAVRMIGWFTEYQSRSAPASPSATSALQPRQRGGQQRCSPSLFSSLPSPPHFSSSSIASVCSGVCCMCATMSSKLRAMAALSAVHVSSTHASSAARSASAFSDSAAFADDVSTASRRKGTMSSDLASTASAS